MDEPGATARVVLPSLPHAAPLPGAVLFGFDEWAFPFRQRVEPRLIPGMNPQVVLRHGPEGAHDEVLLYYGTVIRIGDTFHMWYTGNYGPLDNYVGYERVHCHLCYATSTDGVRWEKPELGLVEFNGSRHNNIVAFPVEGLWSTAAVLHDPEDPDPDRRFKIAVEAHLPGDTRLRMCVAFSPDGWRWAPSPRKPVGPISEMSGIARFRGLYYVNGQSVPTHASRARRLATWVSADFEHWSPCPAVGLDRALDLAGPSTDDDRSHGEQVHLGAALWNRGNVLLGIYGQWHGHPSGDRRLVVMDLGLALSHDALHFFEPIPGFKFIPAREQPETPMGVMPALMQGQGMENVGDSTLYWCSIWRGTEGSGVRLVCWERDRLGMLKPFSPDAPRAVSCPILVTGGAARVWVNATGLGEHTRLRVSLLDRGFQPITGYSGAEAAIIAENGFRTVLRWPGGETLPTGDEPAHLEVLFDGVRPEDACLHALYVGGDV